MASWRKFKLGRDSRTMARRTSRDALLAHRAFAPGLGLWGALVGGMTVMVMPSGLAGSPVAETLIATYDINMQAVIACISAIVLGGAVYALAWLATAGARRRCKPQTLVEAVARKVRPIDPERDLGSRSLDEPLETMPFATPAWRDAEVDAVELVPALPASTASEPGPEGNAPLELDLAQFAEIPGHKVARAEETAEPADPVAVALQPAPVAASASVSQPPLPGTAALARLRAVPTSELSLVEMIERFAGALHEHRNATPAHSLNAAELAAREAALAEALKSLAALSGGAPVPEGAPSEEPLRTALAQLRPRRGFA